MTFTAPDGLMRAVDSKTRQHVGRNNILLGLLDRSLEPEFRAGQERLFLQRREYSSTPDEIDPPATNRARSAGNNPTASSVTGLRTWSNADNANAYEITVRLRNAYEKAVAIPRLDVSQSPLREIENARRVVAQSISDQFENDLRTFFLGLTSKNTNVLADNGNAGSVRKETYGRAGNTFISNTRPYPSTGTDAGDLVLDIIDDFVLKAKRDNLVDGRAVYGDMPGTLYMCMHPELFKYYVVNQLRDKGYQLDPLTAETLRRNSVFTEQAFQGRLGLEGLTIVTPNTLTVPSGNNNWQIWGGYTEAAVGGIGAMLTQLITPEQNQIGDGYVLRQVMNPFFNLLNGRGVVQYEIHVN